MYKYQTLDKFEETVFVTDDSENEDNISSTLNSFFNELLTRRRTDDLEGGLQAGGVILPDKAGFKVAERDGYATHAHTFETVSQYINCEVMFSSEDTIGNMSLRRDDPNSWFNIPKNGFTVRIVATNDTIIFIFDTYSYKLTEFQLEVIDKLYNMIKQAYESQIIKKPYINFITGNYKFIFNEHLNIDNQLESLEQFIAKRKEEIKEKTR